MEEVKVLKEETTPEGVQIKYVQPCIGVCCKPTSCPDQMSKVLKLF